MFKMQNALSINQSKMELVHITIQLSDLTT